ncbi:NDR1/HIN1-like protein 13 [Mercurialis annua]|uniref:NDR1/HIN1-like protein 13 n=1 Tax=Mercurialis annua TaxID=3986 RepID=UPI00215F4CB7|nr:NDR1/HIN1-like protein 13 [Mercurialis annua]
MAERVYPSAKPATNGTTATTTTTTNNNTSFPATKAQLYGASRPAYRPQPQRKRSHRRCCCLCCIWTTVIILTLLLLAALAGVIVYVMYRPHRPTFTVSAFKVSSLNLTSSTSHLNTNINMNITTKNPNKKLVYIYNPVTISVTTAKDNILIGNGVLPSFVHGAKNTTLLKGSITSNGNQKLDDSSVTQLKTDFKGKNGVDLKMEMDTKVKLKLEGLKTPKVGIRVTCEGIKATVPNGKIATSASVSNVKCKVDLRIKIWKWTF